MKRWQWFIVMFGCAVAGFGAITEALAQAATMGSDGVHITTGTFFAWPIVAALIPVAVGAGAIAQNLKSLGMRLTETEKVALAAVPQTTCITTHRERTQEQAAMEDRIVARVRDIIQAAVATNHETTAAGGKRIEG